jgi:hypothetical protein
MWTGFRRFGIGSNGGLFFNTDELSGELLDYMSHFSLKTRKRQQHFTLETFDNIRLSINKVNSNFSIVLTLNLT